jgi:hypothetical protein
VKPLLYSGEVRLIFVTGNKVGTWTKQELAEAFPRAADVKAIIGAVKHVTAARKKGEPYCAFGRRAF